MTSNADYHADPAADPNLPLQRATFHKNLGFIKIYKELCSA
jgi:hypothetical protein